MPAPVQDGVTGSFFDYWTIAPASPLPPVGATPPLTAPPSRVLSHRLIRINYRRSCSVVLTRAKVATVSTCRAGATLY